MTIKEVIDKLPVKYGINSYIIKNLEKEKKYKIIIDNTIYYDARIVIYFLPLGEKNKHLNKAWYFYDNTFSEHEKLKIQLILKQLKESGISISNS